MNIITDKPIIFVNDSYSNADDKPEKKEKSPINADVLQAGASVLTGVGQTIAGRQRQLTDVEQRCGKKPVGKKQRAQWQKCVDANGGQTMSAPAPEPTTPTTPTEQGMSKNMKIGLAIGGVALVGIIVFAIYKAKN
jgi:hypothetical protein